MTGAGTANVAWDPPHPGAWVRDFRLGEWLGDPVTPLFESWLLTRIEDRLQGFYARLLGVDVPEPTHVVVNGWYFYGLHFLPDRPAGLLALLVRHALPRLLLRPRRTAIAFPPLARFAVGTYEREWRSDLLPRYRRLVAVAEAEIPSAVPDRLIALIDRLAEAAGDYFVSVTAVAGYASKAEFPLARFYTRHVAPAIGGSHLDLLCGLGPALATTPTHAVRSIDWAEATMGELRPANDGWTAERRHATARARRTEAEARAHAALAGDARRLRAFERRLATAQRSAIVREEVIDQWTLPWPVFRRAVLRLGDELVRRRVLELADDVWFLRHDELIAAIAGAPSFQPIVARDRRSRWGVQRGLTPPLRLGTVPPMLRDLFGAGERAIRGSAASAPVVGDAIIGLPASAGTATGPVRIVRSIDAFADVRAGDVLVAPVTAPAWTPLFDRVAAIVTDTGGAASHASIVAREYGIPAVVATVDATRRLHDGQIVEVDGSTGIVRTLPSSIAPRPA
jgi:pyruvate,water dikinase